MGRRRDSRPVEVTTVVEKSLERDMPTAWSIAHQRINDALTIWEACQ